MKLLCFNALMYYHFRVLFTLENGDTCFSVMEPFKIEFSEMFLIPPVKVPPRCHSEIFQPPFDSLTLHHDYHYHNWYTDFHPLYR